MANDSRKSTEGQYSLNWKGRKINDTPYARRV